MMHPVHNTGGMNQASGGIRCVCTIILFSLLLFAYPAGVGAGDEQSGPFLFTSSTRTTKDIFIETKVRQALRQDAQLRPLNLIVHMIGGVASLSGPVPNVELKKRAITIAQRVEGVLSVNDKDLYISTSDQGGQRLTVVIQNEPPIRTRSASPGSPTSGLRSFDARLSTSTNQQITLLAPEMAAPVTPTLPSPKLGDGKAEKARLTANPHPASPAVSISTALEQLRQRESRYQQIRTRVQGTTVIVFPSDTSSEDAMTFAQAVRRLPGVQHVILSSDPR